MGPYYDRDGITIHHGDCLDILPAIRGVTAIVTDPPAGISFMGKDWDGAKGGRDAWIQWMTGIASAALQALPPGGIALVWAIPRTSHWTATAWENGGWEVRDRISHIFGSGFPKSLDVSKAIDKQAGAEREVVGTKPNSFGRQKGGGPGWAEGITGEQIETHDFNITTPATPAATEWQGYGTALKPACEDWWLFQKPIEGTYAANAIKHGVAGINIDGARVGTEEMGGAIVNKNGTMSSFNDDGGKPQRWKQGYETKTATGRWPSNLILSGDDVAGLFPVTGPSIARDGKRTGKESGRPGAFAGQENVTMGHDDNGGSAARFFQQCPHRDPIDEANRIIYTAKASGSDRGNRDEKQLPLFGETEEAVKNTHPTVKPLTLMEYLIRLVTMPSGTVILDPFGGSGSTAVACQRLGIRCILIEQDEESCSIAASRLRSDDGEGSG